MSHQPRTVRLMRGPKGFGFNLAGECPCYLSAVHEHSVAAVAGLRKGDTILNVNGFDVSELPHRDIVAMIGETNVSPWIYLTVVSSASELSSEQDSDTEVWRRQRLRSQARSAEFLLRADVLRRKRHRHRSLQRRSKDYIYNHKRTTLDRGRKKPPTNRLNRSLSEPDYLHELKAARRPQQQQQQQLKSGEKRDTSLIVHSGAVDSSDTCSSDDDDTVSQPSCTEELETTELIFKAVVVYIGAVPIAYPFRSRQQVIRHGLQSLRAQKVKASTVLLEIFADQVVITNTKQAVIARFGARKLEFVAPCAQNKQYFAVATTHAGPDCSGTTDTSTSATVSETDDLWYPHGGGVCHLFAVDPQLHLHSLHYQYARKFEIKCSKDPTTNMCMEFPYISTPLLHALSYVYRTNGTLNTTTTQHADLRSRQPRGYTSSNSDSGIGEVLARGEGSRNGPLRKSIGGCNKAVRFADEVQSRSAPQTPSKQSSISDTASVNGSSACASMCLNLSSSRLDVSPLKNAVKLARSVPLSSSVRRMLDTMDPVQTESAENNQANLPQADNLDRIEESRRLLPPSYQAFSFDLPLPLAPTGKVKRESSGENNHAVMSNGESTVAATKQPHPLLPMQRLRDAFAKERKPSLDSALMQQQKAERRSIDASSPSPSQLSYRSQSPAYSDAGGSQQDLNDDCGVTATANIFVNKKISEPAPPSSDYLCLPPQARMPRRSLTGSQPDLKVTLELPGTSHSTTSLRARLHQRFARSDSLGKTKQERKERLDLWASDFDALLRDPAGLYVFKEYLAKQFCQENIAFWVACENFKAAADCDRDQVARSMFCQHFEAGCPEPVNIDSTAKHQVETAIQKNNITIDLFASAQLQIFNLMRYDCWPRFLKSEQYNQCWDAVQRNLPLKQVHEPFLGNAEPQRLRKESSSTGPGEKTGLFGGGDDKKKRLLNWKGVSKFARRTKKELLSGGANAVQNTDSSAAQRKKAWQKNRQASMPMHSQLALDRKCSMPEQKVPAVPDLQHQQQAFLNVLLPGQTSTQRVSLAKQHVTVRDWLLEVASKYSLNADAVDIVDTVTSRDVDLASPVQPLAGRTLDLRGGVLLRLEIPNSSNGQRKEVVVKAGVDKTSGQVLRPVLSKYELELDGLVVIVSGSTEVIPNHAPVKQADGKLLKILTQQEFQDWVHGEEPRAPPLAAASSSSLKDSPGRCSQRSDTSSCSGSGGMLKFVRKPSPEIKSGLTHTSAAAMLKSELDRERPVFDTPDLLKRRASGSSLICSSTTNDLDTSVVSSNHVSIVRVEQQPDSSPWKAPPPYPGRSFMTPNGTSGAAVQPALPPYLVDSRTRRAVYLESLQNDDLRADYV